MSSNQAGDEPAKQEQATKPGDAGGRVGVLAAREVAVTLKNNLDVPLYRHGTTVAHGDWQDDSYPPEIIDAGESGHWGTKSDGFLTGTEATTNYTIFISTDSNDKAVKATDEDPTDLQMWWANPYSGGNQYNAGIVGPRKGDYKVNFDGGSGNHSKVTYTLSKK